MRISCAPLIEYLEKLKAMMIPKQVVWILIVMIVPLLFWGSIQFFQYNQQNTDPCLNQSRDVLVQRFPSLAELIEHQRQQTDDLMARQRAEDLMINMQLNDEQFGREDAVKMSMLQIQQLAALRNQQKEEFNTTCRKLVAAAD